MAQLTMNIDNIDPATIQFVRPGIIPLGPLEMSFQDQAGDGYEMSCGGDRLNMRFLKSASFSSLMLDGYLENCLEQILSMKEAQEQGKNLVALEFSFARKQINGRKMGRNQVELHAVYE